MSLCLAQLAVCLFVYILCFCLHVCFVLLVSSYFVLFIELVSSSFVGCISYFVLY